MKYIRNSHENRMNIMGMTANQPFCAGVIAFFQGKLVLTLNSDGLPDGSRDTLRIGAVGGGQEPNETIVDCARREAEEELSVQKVELLPAPVTYFHDMDTDQIQEIEPVDPIAPFLFQRQTNPAPNTPYKQGLPVGPFVYFNMFFADIFDSTIRPGDDVVALLLVPINKWEILERDCTIGTAIEQGIEIITGNKQSDVLPSISNDTRLFLPKDESFRTVVPLLRNLGSIGVKG